MNEFFIVVLFLSAGFAVMLLALKFARYRQKTSGCCGGGHCELPHDQVKDHACRMETQTQDLK